MTRGFIGLAFLLVLACGDDDEDRECPVIGTGPLPDGGALVDIHYDCEEPPGR